MKFEYDKNKTQRIINHEDVMLKTYSKIISTYSSLFKQYDWEVLFPILPIFCFCMNEPL